MSKWASGHGGRKAAPRWVRRRIASPKTGDDGADDEAARAVVPAEDGHQRHDDAETDEVNEDRQENDEQRWFAD